MNSKNDNECVGVLQDFPDIRGIGGQIIREYVGFLGALGLFLSGVVFLVESKIIDGKIMDRLIEISCDIARIRPQIRRNAKARGFIGVAIKDSVCHRWKCSEMA